MFYSRSGAWPRSLPRPALCRGSCGVMMMLFLGDYAFVRFLVFSFLSSILSFLSLDFSLLSLFFFSSFCFSVLPFLFCTPSLRVSLCVCVYVRIFVDNCKRTHAPFCQPVLVQNTPAPYASACLPSCLPANSLLFSPTPPDPRTHPASVSGAPPRPSVDQGHVGCNAPRAVVKGQQGRLLRLYEGPFSSLA